MPFVRSQRAGSSILLVEALFFLQKWSKETQWRRFISCRVQPITSSSSNLCYLLYLVRTASIHQVYSWGVYWLGIRQCELSTNPPLLLPPLWSSKFLKLIHNLINLPQCELIIASALEHRLPASVWGQNTERRESHSRPVPVGHGGKVHGWLHLQGHTLIAPAVAERSCATCSFRARSLATCTFFSHSWSVL